MTAAPTPEFSVVVTLEDVPDTGYAVSISADPGERAALAGRFGLQAIDRLDADLRVDWLNGATAVRVSGRVRADVTQTCVVTLEPVAATIDAEISLVFADEAAAEEAADVVVDLDEAEPLEGDSLDLGEIAATEVSLLLDPYPRRADIDPATLGLGPGAGLRDDDEPDEGEPRNNPFEKLAALRPKH